MSRATHLSEYALFKALRPHFPAREYALLPQVANATGAGTFRHCDGLALSLWPSRGLYLHGFEIKSYRADWIRELKNPEKAEEIAQYCNYWWIVAAHENVVKQDELPEPWGLFVWHGEGLAQQKKAPYRDAIKPDLAFLAAALRKAQEVVTPEGALKESFEKGLQEGIERRDLRAEQTARDLKKLQEQVAGFEAVSGIQLDCWESGEKIGLAVEQVLTGSVNRQRDNLLNLAKRIVDELGRPS